MKKIEDLSALRPGWNGHGAAGLAASSRHAAEDLLRRIYSEFGGSVAEPTVVSPTSDGGVALEWIVKDGDRVKGIEIVLLPGDRNEYSVRDRESGRLEDDGESVGVQHLLFKVIKTHVAGRFILAK